MIVAAFVVAWGGLSVQFARLVALFLLFVCPPSIGDQAIGDFRLPCVVALWIRCVYKLPAVLSVPHSHKQDSSLRTMLLARAL